MSFWDWPCETFFSECTIQVATGISSVVILLAVAIRMVAIATDVIKKVIGK